MITSANSPIPPRITLGQRVITRHFTCRSTIRARQTCEPPRSKNVPAVQRNRSVPTIDDAAHVSSRRCRSTVRHSAIVPDFVPDRRWRSCPEVGVGYRAGPEVVIPPPPQEKNGCGPPDPTTHVIKPYPHLRCLWGYPPTFSGRWSYVGEPFGFLVRMGRFTHTPHFFRLR